MVSRHAAPRIATGVLSVLAFVAGPPAMRAGQALLHDAAEANVNQRYLVESVSFAGTDLARVEESSLPPDLRERLTALIGQRCDTETLESLAADIRRELHLREVSEHLSRGSAPDRVRVNFETVRREEGFDVSLPRFLYHSQLGFSGEVEASAHYKQNSLMFGIVSNGDDLTERYSGVEARYRSGETGPAGLHADLTFESYHELWNPATLAALEPRGPELYRSRWNVAPDVGFRVAPGVTASVGASFEHTESEVPGAPERPASVVTLDLRGVRRYQRGAVRRQIEGRYSLRVATRALGSGYAYARHLVTLRYQAKTGRHMVADELMAGSITGDAPFFERFVLGSSSTLRGWDRYEIDPLGGSHVVHNEISYSYKVGGGAVEAFYDSGALWQFDRAVALRHSLGAGYRRGVFVLTLAFPVREGQMEPVFMAGMNY